MPRAPAKAASGQRRADLILVNAQVVTNDPQRPLVEEVALRGGLIAGVGSGLARDTELSRGARILDCGGGAVLPGFVDAHLHFFALAGAFLSADLRPSNGVRSIRALAERLREAACVLNRAGVRPGRPHVVFRVSGRLPSMTVDEVRDAFTFGPQSGRTGNLNVLGEVLSSAGGAALIYHPTGDQFSIDSVFPVSI